MRLLESFTASLMMKEATRKCPHGPQSQSNSRLFLESVIKPAKKPSWEEPGGSGDIWEGPLDLELGCGCMVVFLSPHTVQMKAEIVSFPRIKFPSLSWLHFMMKFDKQSSRLLKA